MRATNISIKTGETDFLHARGDETLTGENGLEKIVCGCNIRR
jgi:hypothetical protein